MEKQKILSLIEQTGLIVVVRGMDPDEVLPLVDALAKGGAKAIEITMNSRDPLKLIQQIKAASKDTGITVGAGTVLDGETARAAILAGAEFIFSPILSLDLIEMCRRYTTLAMPGVMTPTEMMTAWQAGADLLKIFPANVLGPGYIKGIKEPLDGLKVIPTGGIGLDNAADYIRAGATALGVGGGLIDRQAVAARDFGVITQKTRELIRVIQAARVSE